MAVQNVCHCINPPGGQGQCEPNQLAICRARGGHCISKCSNPPADARFEPQMMYAWALTEITGMRHVPPLSEQELHIIASGKYVDPKTDEVITFVLPQSWPRSGGFGTSSASGAPRTGGGAVAAVKSRA